VASSPKTPLSSVRCRPVRWNGSPSRGRGARWLIGPSARALRGANRPRRERSACSSPTSWRAVSTGRAPLPVASLGYGDGGATRGSAPVARLPSHGRPTPESECALLIDANSRKGSAMMQRRRDSFETCQHGGSGSCSASSCLDSDKPTHDPDHAPPRRRPVTSVTVVQAVRLTPVRLIQAVRPVARRVPAQLALPISRTLVLCVFRRDLNADSGTT
jgi:hypothetical protein